MRNRLKAIGLLYMCVFMLLDMACQVSQVDDLREDGDSCEGDSECRSGACEENICAPSEASDTEKKSLGEPCTQNSDCQINFCLSGICSEPTEIITEPKETGESCESSEECGFGACERGICQPLCETSQLCFAADSDLGICCSDGEQCLVGRCVEVGSDCTSDLQCDVDERCLPSLEQCVSNSETFCEYRPPTGIFEPVIECQWPGSQELSVAPDKPFVVMTPLVGNMTDDNADGRTDTDDIPDLVFTSYQVANDLGSGRHSWWEGVIRIATGQCDENGNHPTIHTIDIHDIDSSAGLAIGDLTGDGVMEIVAITDARREGGAKGGVAVYRRESTDGTAWSTYAYKENALRFGPHTRGAPAPSLADINGDGSAEIIIGNVVFDKNLNVVFDGLSGLDDASISVGDVGVGNNGFLGPSSTVGNFDGVDGMEIFAGNTLYNSDGTIRWTYAYGEDVSAQPCQGEGGGNPTPCDGFNGYADFDQDGVPELVSVVRGYVVILSLDGEEVASIPIPIDDCSRNEGGPPNIGDFDGDGRPEIGTAAGDFFAVFDLDCLGKSIPEECVGPGVLWKMANQDCSSRVTASSIFDFEGDGRSEVVYADEQNFYILDGKTGEQLFVDTEHNSHTRLEMPIVVDVDNDGNAEVLVPETSNSPRPGISTWGDALDNWVPTRRIWNQHAYYVSNISERGAIQGPGDEQNWQNPRLNSFRQNFQGAGAFWAPDIRAVLPESICDGLTTELTFEVANEGTQRVSAGVAIEIRDAEEQVIWSGVTSQALLPGASGEIFQVQFERFDNTTYTIWVDVDEAHNECVDYSVDPTVPYGEENNSTPVDVTCVVLEG